MNQVNKPGKLSKVEQYSVQGMLEENLSIKQMAKVLGRTPRIIEKYIKSIERPEVVTEDLNSSKLEQALQQITNLQKALPDESPLKPETMKGKKNARDEMRITRETGDKKRNIGSVMTSAASSRGDDDRKKYPKGHVGRHVSGNIYCISENRILTEKDNLEDI